MSPGFSFASLNQIQLAVDVETITTAACYLRHHINALAVLHRHPFCLPDIYGGVSEMNCRYVFYPDILSRTYTDKIPTMLLVRRIFFLFASVFEHYLRVEF